MVKLAQLLNWNKFSYEIFKRNNVQKCFLCSHGHAILGSPKSNHPRGFKRNLNQCAGGQQCVQIGVLFRQLLVTNFLTEVAENIWWICGYFEKYHYLSLKLFCLLWLELVCMQWVVQRLCLNLQSCSPGFEGFESQLSISSTVLCIFCICFYSWNDEIQYCRWIEKVDLMF